MLATIKATDGQGGYDFGQVVFEDRKLVSFSDYDRIFMDLLTIHGAPSYTDLDIPELDGGGIFLEVYLSGSGSVVSRHTPDAPERPDFEKEVTELFRKLSPESTEEQIKSEVQVRKAVYRIVSWFEDTWNLSAKRKENADKVSDAISEPAPNAASSSHQD